MILKIVATVSERHAPPSHVPTHNNSKTKETVLTSNKMSMKYFYGISNKREQKGTSDRREPEERQDMT